MVRGGHHVPVSDFDAAITMALSLGFLFRAAMITFIAPALTSERFSPSGGNTSEFLEIAEQFAKLRTIDGKF